MPNDAATRTNPHTRGCALRLPHVARIVSGMPDCPCASGAVPPLTNHLDFTPKENRAERVQTVNAAIGNSELREFSARKIARRAIVKRRLSGTARPAAPDPQY
jgi:hypothetical protein